MNDNNKLNKQSDNLSQQRQRYLELTKKIDSMQRIKNILSCHIDYILNKIIRDVFIPQMKEMLKPKGLSMVDSPSDYDWVNSSYSGFWIQEPNWTYFKIGIEFETRKLKSPIIGFLRKKDYDRNEIECWNELQKTYSRKEPNNQSWVYKNFKGPSDWYNKESVSQLLDGTMVKIFQEMIDEMLDCADNVKEKGFVI